LPTAQELKNLLDFSISFRRPSIWNARMVYIPHQGARIVAIEYDRSESGKKRTAVAARTIKKAACSHNKLKKAS